jgi:hypothetical protein
MKTILSFSMLLLILFSFSCQSSPSPMKTEISLDQIKMNGSRKVLTGPGEGAVVGIQLSFFADKLVTGVSDSEFSGTYKTDGNNIAIAAKGYVSKKNLNYTLHINGTINDNSFEGTFIQTFEGVESQTGSIVMTISK